jgi:hypothetical protein
MLTQTLTLRPVGGLSGSRLHPLIPRGTEPVALHLLPQFPSLVAADFGFRGQFQLLENGNIKSDEMEMENGNGEWK